MASHRSNKDSEKLKISAMLCSIELRIQDITGWRLESHASYSTSLTSGGMVEPFIKLNVNLPSRIIVTTLNKGR
jgi:hypothetical protein